MKLLTLLAAITLAVGYKSPSPRTFLPPPHSGSSFQLQAVLTPGDNVFVLGRGPVMVLSSKIAASNGYKTSLISPPDPTIQEQFDKLLFEGDDDARKLPLTILRADETDEIETAAKRMNALIIAVDNEQTLDNSVVDFFFDNISPDSLKRVVLMSRHLNGAKMGFFVETSKKVANSEVWANTKASNSMYRATEEYLKKKINEKTPATELTIIRAGTLKGGGWGEGKSNPTHLSDYFYELTKKDIITWQLLFDCESSGVLLSKGDVCEGAGATAILTASSPKVHKGDSSRGGVAGAMVQSLRMEQSGLGEFGVETAESRLAPSNDEWDQLFRAA